MTKEFQNYLTSIKERALADYGCDCIECMRLAHKEIDQEIAEDKEGLK